VPGRGGGPLGSASVGLLFGARLALGFLVLAMPTAATATAAARLWRPLLSGGRLVGGRLQIGLDFNIGVGLRFDSGAEIGFDFRFIRGAEGLQGGFLRFGSLGRSGPLRGRLPRQRRRRSLGSRFRGVLHHSRLRTG
jgi:hypothetical protein